MRSFLNPITDLVASKRGMWITLGVWLLAVILLAGFAPSAKEYEATSIESIPADAQSVIAQNKVDQYFSSNDGIPAILVFQSKDNTVQLSEITGSFEKIAGINGIKQIVPLTTMPPTATANFFSKDQTTFILPLLFDKSLETKDLRTATEEINKIFESSTNISVHITGPAGIAVDSLNLFSRADIVLLLSTVGLILILLIVIYRSPLLALIPLVAAAFVYEIVNQVLGLMGKAGLLLSNQSLSIVTILLFAAVIDYSLFVFSRFREELKKHENKYEAMKFAMRETAVPVFFAGGTVLIAMLVLFFAKYRDYQNFAPIFAIAVLFVMLASITLVPALFTLFGRKSFWPRIPKVGDETFRYNSMWTRIGRFVVKRPAIAASVISLILFASASYMLNLNYEFDTMKSFPKDMPSRLGYEILEAKFDKGNLAQTTVLYESQQQIEEAQQQKLSDFLADQPFVSSVRPNGTTEDKKVMQFSLTFKESPYAVESMNALRMIRDGSEKFLSDNSLNGQLYFAGETAKKVDDRLINNRDLVVIILLECVLILVMLIFMIRSVKMSIYMLSTIIISYLAAMGLGMFLLSLFFDIHSISNRVPIYSFVFLVALGIDYNIVFISRYLEERAKSNVKRAVETAVATTGGVISSAGIILAATFAVLMTQPVQVLFVFGFIVSLGILLDTFLIRGILLPSLIVLFEKDPQSVVQKQLAKRI